MKTTYLKQLITTTTIAVLMVGYAHADGTGPTPIAGSISGAYVKQEAQPVMDAEGHVMLLGEFNGTNQNTGMNEYFDGAEVINKEMADLTQGNGPQNGYITMKKGQDSVIMKWHGNVTTVMVENQPRTTFKGSWQHVNGTGQYNGLSGRGTYDGYFTSQTEYTVNWKGNYTR